MQPAKPAAFVTCDAGKEDGLVHRFLMPRLG